MQSDAHKKLLQELEDERKEVRRDAWFTVLTFVGLLAGVVVQFSDGPLWALIASFGLAYLTGGVPASIDAFNALREKKLDIHLLMVLAALAAAGVGEARDGAILLFLFSLANTLEGYAMGNTKRAVVALMKLRPEEATRLLDDGTTEVVPVGELAVGDRVQVKPGERIPIDGAIESGIGPIDQSSVTGESVPVDKAPGDEVFAGTVNQHVFFTLTVTKPAEQSTIARMIELVTAARETRSPSERFSDWFGQRYTFVVLFGSVIALGVFLLIGLPTDESFYKFATLLVVASPCAIVISVPAAVLSALTAAARRGVLFKGGSALETFGTVSIMAFDKTGTLTEGKMYVTDVASVSSTRKIRDVLQWALSLEQHSEHPLAQSVCSYASAQDVTPLPTTGAHAVPGKGVVATIAGREAWAGNRALAAMREVTISEEIQEQLKQFERDGKTTVLVGDGADVIGIVAIADQLRPTAQSTIDTFSRRGIAKIVMLTGDTKTVAAAVGKKLSITKENTYGELLPEDKVHVISDLRKEGTVAFVGDGVNDAAALATSHVGVAMGVGGSDVALEAADVALLSDNLGQLSEAHAVARQANRIIKQNLIFSVGIMLLMVFYTIFAYLPLPLGVLGHEGGTILVVLNGLRMLFMKPRAC